MKEYLLNEKKMNTKQKIDSINTEVSNATMKAIDMWIKKNVDPIMGWDSPQERDEVMLGLAKGMMDFYNGMKRASKQGLMKGKK